MANDVLLKNNRQQEKHKLETISQWYSNRNWGFYTKIVEYTYLSIKPFFVKGNVLEIGPADGEMTRLMVNDFNKITVVDAAEKYVKKVTQISPKITGHVSLIEDYKVSKRFNTIIMAHLLEHLIDPVKVLKHVSTFLAPLGNLVVVVPNAQSIHRQVGVKMGLLKKTTDLNDADKSVDHKRVYTPQLFKKHIKKAGLNIVQNGGIYFKPLSNTQINANWSEELMDAFYELGKDHPQLCSEIFTVCRKEK